MEQFVTCGGVDCSVCSLLTTVSTIFKWSLGISALTATILVIFGGFNYLLAAGNSVTLAKAKRLIFYALGGFFGVLTAFLIIQFSIVNLLGVTSQQNWWQFSCQDDFGVASLDSKIAKKDLANLSGKLLTTIQDEKPILENIASLSELVTSDNKIATLDPNKLDTINLQQDLVNLISGDQIKFFAGLKNIDQTEIKQLIEENNGFIPNQTNLDSLSLNNLQTIVTIKREDGDIAIKGEGDLANISGIYSIDDESLPDKIAQISDILKEKANQDLIIAKDARSEGSMGTCLDSGGDWIQFLNECYARRENYGQEKINCSPQVSNLVMGCSCPAGTSLLGSRCVDKNDLLDQNNLSDNQNNNQKTNNNDDDHDGVTNKLDVCPNTPAGEQVDSNPYSERLGCSCSQINLATQTCPANRCEGNNLVTYSTQKDTCQNGIVKNSSCLIKSSEYNETCYQMSQTSSLPAKQQIASQDPSTNSKLQDWFNRSNNNNNGSGSNQGGNGNNGGGDRTGGGTNNGGTNNGGTPPGDNNNNQDTIPPDKGPGSFNPTPNFEEMAKCIGFKDGKIPYNGVLVTLLNKEDPTNALHPSRNASRLFYLDRYGNVVGNSGDKNAGGLAVGPWTKGSGGEAWSPEWVIFNAQTHHKNEVTGSFRSGTGYRIRPAGEALNSNGTINNNPPPANAKPSYGIQGMSGCNMHSGNNRSHSAGCMTMGGTERQGLTQYVKSMATKSGGTVMMAVLTADNTDPNSQKFQSDYCGKMDPEKALAKFKTLQAYQNYNPNEGYNTATVYQNYGQGKKYD